MARTSEEPESVPEASPDAAQSRFLPLSVPERLWVPCALRPPFATVPLKPAGRAVSPGEALVETEFGSEHTPLAPTAGRVGEIGRITLLNTREVPAVLIEANPVAPSTPRAIHGTSDFTPLPIEAVRELLSNLRRTDLGPSIDRLRHAGVWADRWTSPDLSGQLHACRSRPVDTIFCSLLDIDAALGVNRACAEIFPTEIVAAVAALARLTGAARAWLMVDAEGDSGTWAGVRRVAAEAAGDLRLVPVDNDYPQPDPTLLLYTLTGRKLRPGLLPTDRGVLLLDAAAAVAVGRALVAGEPMLRVPLAVHDGTGSSTVWEAEELGELGETSDEGAAEEGQGVTHLVTAVVGTPLRDVLGQLGIIPGAAPRTGGHGLELRAGGPMREMRVTGDCIVGGSELGIFVAPREPDVNPDPCIRCGWCVEGCPVRAHPAALLEAAQMGDVPQARRYGLDACIECGICSYVCPSHLPLLHAIRTLRGERELDVDE